MDMVAWGRIIMVDWEMVVMARETAGRGRGRRWRCRRRDRSNCHQFPIL